MTLRDPYTVLGVRFDADQDAITAAHRRLARRFHPDVSREPDAEQRMAEINAAWTILRDPARRAAWDAANLPPLQRAASLAAQEAARAAAADAAARRPSNAGTPAASSAPPPAPAPSGAGPRTHDPPPGSLFQRTAAATGAATGPSQPVSGAGTAWRVGPNGEGAAGPPPGNPSGSVLQFGRHIGWSLGEILRYDPGYLTWLRERREGAPYREEIDKLIAAQKAGQQGGPRGAVKPESRRRFPFR